jgi:SAM-dependent methyltransferase
VFSCRICGYEQKSRSIHAQEMMFGTREKFLYDVCASCGSVQISEIPDIEILSRHYPKAYYSLKDAAEVKNANSGASLGSLMRAKLAGLRDLHAVGIRSLVGGLIQHLRPAPPALNCLASVKISLSDRILDVGCGAQAELLDRLARAGFRNLLGCDPFISDDTTTQSGVRVLKKTIRELSEKFDLIMFHHSFEHVPNPRETLENARRLLRSGGFCVIRTPTPSSEAFGIYGAQWVQLDAPRHLSLPTREGMTILAKASGFSVENILDDSSRFQFAASEMYLRDIPLVDQRETDVFTTRELQSFDERSKLLNSVHRGDQAAFILRAL